MSKQRHPLQVVTQRIDIASPKGYLPHIVPVLALDLHSSRSALSTRDGSQQSRDSTEAAGPVHKFETQMNSHILGTNPENRWSAIVLIKAYIEAAGLDVPNEWIRGLINLLSVRWQTTWFPFRNGLNR